MTMSLHSNMAKRVNLRSGDDLSRRMAAAMGTLKYEARRHNSAMAKANVGPILKAAMAAREAYRTIYLIVDVPADTAVTTPLPSIVATPVDAELHEPPVPLVDKVVVPFEHNAVVPLISPASGAAVIVTVLVAVSFEQPPVPVTT